MTSNVHREDSKDSKTIHLSSGRPIPKNLRQIGKINEGLKIYVEDYVKTFIRQLAESEPDEITAAVLVGEYAKNEEDRYVFIYGAIKLHDILHDEEIKLSEDTWTSVYETIKHYFPEGEITGWYIRKNEWTERNYGLIKSVHLDNFAGRDKVVLQYDILERDGDFYCYENNELVPQGGYFVYYDKNEQMQDYMIDNKQVNREEQFVEERAVREFRNMYQEKHPENEKNSQKSVTKMSYAAGMVVVMVVMAIGVTAFKNQEKVKDLEETLQTISSNLTSGEELSPIPSKPAGNIFENVEKEPTKEPIEEPTPSEVPEPTEEPTPTEAPEPTKEPTPTEAPEPTKEPTPTEAPEPTKAPDPTKEPEPLQPVVTPEQLTIYVVEQGDTLAGICYKLYGSAENLKLIQEMNQIVDENKIYIGQELAIPKK